MAPFYINMCIHILYIPLFLFLLPESLSSEARMILDKNAKLAHQAANDRDAAEREWENETPAVELANPLEQRTATSSKRTKRLRGSLRRTFRRATGFLQPLAIFLPREMEDGRKDWSLTFVGCSISCMSMLYVSCHGNGTSLMAGNHDDENSIYTLYLWLDICTGELCVSKHR